jgi:hypothetical protein
MVMANWLSTCRRLKLDFYVSPCTKIISKWIKGLNVRLKTLKILQKRIRKTMEDIGIGNNFLNKTPFAKGKN